MLPFCPRLREKEPQAVRDDRARGDRLEDAEFQADVDAALFSGGQAIKAWRGLTIFLGLE